jgi:hypothetical protein
MVCIYGYDMYVYEEQLKQLGYQHSSQTDFLFNEFANYAEIISTFALFLYLT